MEKGQPRDATLTLRNSSRMNEWCVAVNKRLELPFTCDVAPVRCLLSVTVTCTV